MMGSVPLLLPLHVVGLLTFPRYWPVLDTALRTAAVSRGVRVRLLVSCWLNTDPSMFPFLRSLQALSHPAAGISLDVVSLTLGRRWAPTSTPS